MNKTLARKYLTSINSNKRKYVTCEDLSISFGKFPESIASDLSVFEPLIILDMSLNLKDLVPAIEKYIEEQHYSVNAEKFYSYYESNGWKIGKSSMKSWKAALRTWNLNNKEQNTVMHI